MKKQLLFHRDFRGYTGGHGKVWDYFNHALAHPDWNACAFLTRQSTFEGNPWAQVREYVLPDWTPIEASALFLGGMDWQACPHEQRLPPVINLVQHVRHADPTEELHGFLRRRAIRICVSQAVANAIIATGQVNGPVRVIPAALDLAALPVAGGSRRGVFIGAQKQVALGQALAIRLRADGYKVMLSDQWLPRAEYLAQMATAEIAVLLPDPREGFYLPGLEAMALGCATVLPDCVGNREYTVPDINALTPSMDVDALAAAVAAMDDLAVRDRISRSGLETARSFQSAREREAFHAILDDLDALWNA